MPHEFITLRHPVEKLLEAEYFLVRMVGSNSLEFQFELNAFLSASRSVSFVLQKAMSDVPGFAVWYGERRLSMKADAAMGFFLELRNISQKQGPVSFVGGSLLGGGWTYRFLGWPKEVPQSLIGRDIGACCAEHLSKLAKLILGCCEAFPYHSCPAQAFTEDGMVALGYSMEDAEVAVGLPPGWTDVVDFPISEKLRWLRREIEPLDVDSIKRLAVADIRGNGSPLKFPVSNGTDLVDDIAEGAATPEGNNSNARANFLNAIVTRIARDGRP
jgi:hypothetical protein